MSFAVTKVEEYEVPSAKWRSMPFAVCTSSSIAMRFKVFRTLVPHEDNGNCGKYRNNWMHTVRTQTIQCARNCNWRQKHQAKQEPQTCKVLHKDFSVVIHQWLDMPLVYALGFTVHTDLILGRVYDPFVRVTRKIHFSARSANAFSTVCLHAVMLTDF